MTRQIAARARHSHTTSQARHPERKKGGCLEWFDTNLPGYVDAQRAAVPGSLTQFEFAPGGSFDTYMHAQAKVGNARNLDYKTHYADDDEKMVHWGS